MASLRAIVKTLRPHQWVKNLFVLAPLVFARHLLDAPYVVRGLAAGTSVSDGGGTTETWGYLNEILSASMQGDRLGNRRVRRALRPRIRGMPRTA